MLSVRVISIGKVKEKYFTDAISEYMKRLKPMCKIEIIEIPESRLPQSPSEKDIDASLIKEGSLILQKAEGALFPLCIEGTQHSSQDFASLINRVMMSDGKLSFIIGSSHGLSHEVKEKGQKISMSKMTFPHTLARVMLIEQIYRAMQINSGGKYHK